MNEETSLSKFLAKSGGHLTFHERMRKVTFASATHLQEDEKGIFCWWHSSARRNQNLQATDTTHSHHSHRHILHTINLGKNIP